ncbi:hypothetical protein [uncultured Thomasclavelia sp.]|uniref:hypothetical protein n=1 Tax=uncultured Thomasclavelia sp. TaxID=3025759 RepID=UPI0025963BBE|nr:hypothetical protein [uncultured Thomasclavelia sp.]
MAKNVEIKLKYPEARIRALRSVLAKRNTTLEIEMMEALFQLYKKNVKPEVREFIEEIEEQETPILKKAKSSQIEKGENSKI